MIALEPEPHLREHGERAARQAAVPVTVVDSVAEELPFPDAAFDAALASLMRSRRPASRSSAAIASRSRIPPLDPPKPHVLGVARRAQAPGSRPVA